MDPSSLAAPDADERIETGDVVSLPMAAAAYVTSLVGLQAVALVSYDPAFSLLMVVLLTLGSATSYLCRVFRLAPNPLEMPAVALFMVVGLVALGANDALPIVSPRNLAEVHANRMALFLAWILIGLSFAGSYNVRLLFSAVPALAAIGLVSTMSADPIIPTLFLVYVFGASFMVLHENWLRAATAARSRGRHPGPSLLSGQLLTAAFCTLCAALVSNLTAPQLHGFGSQLTGTSLPLTIPAPPPSARASTNLVPYGGTGIVPIGTGPVTLSNQIVLRVRASESAYWCSASFGRYDGHAWYTIGDSNREMRRYEGPERPNEGVYGRRLRATYVVDVTDINAVHGPSHLLRQTVQLVGGAHSDVALAAAEPRLITLYNDMPGLSPMNPPHADENGRILIAGAQALQYEVQSQVADWTPESLRRSGTDYPRVGHTDLSGVPADALARIRKAAWLATRDARNPFDRVQAIVRYVSHQCVYNTAARAVPADRDAVDYFLFDSKEGYCDSFASAVAVLCRSIGIPARVASGFLPGEFDADSGWYVVRDRDRHLWAEVYFVGVGWVPFDATTDAEDRSPPNPADPRNQASLGILLFRRGWLPPLALVVFLCLLGYVLKVEVLDQLLARRPGAVVCSLPPTNERVARAYLASCEMLARRGLRRGAEQTPEEFACAAERWLGDAPDALAPLRRLSDRVTRFCYSAHVASDQDVADALADQRQLRDALRRRPRRRSPRSSAVGRPS